MLNLIKVIGIILIVVALIWGMILVGRIESEDMAVHEGELLQSQMMSDGKIAQNALSIIIIFVSGMVVYAGGVAIDNAVERREIRINMFDDDDEDVIEIRRK